MAYKHKRSSVAGNIPATGILKVGEIAVNFADKSIYTEDTGGNVIELARDIPRLANAPATATKGDTYFDTTTNELKYYNGTVWVTPSTGTVTSVATGTGLTGGPISTTGTIALADTAVIPGSQGSANSVAIFTVDQQGRLTSAGNTSIAIDWTQVTSGKPTTLTGYGITDGVKTVNGVVPDAAGNVAVALGNVSTGLSGAYPASAVEGDIFIVSGDTTENNGKTYIYDGSSWVEISGPDMAAYDARYVNVTGDTMTGTLTLSGAPTTDNEAATKKYVDDLVANNEVVISTLAFDGSNVTITENKGNTFTVDIATGLDSRYVNVTGDTMTGTLGIVGLSANGAVGTAGQVLTSDGANTYWSTPSYFDANAQITFANTIAFSSTVSVNALSANGTVGTAGQVLISTGTDTYWGTDNVAVFEVIAGAGLSGGTITANGIISVNTDHSFLWTNTHSFSNTVTINAVSANGALGTAGQVLTSNGSSTFWADASGLTFTNATSSPVTSKLGDEWYDTTNDILHIRVSDGSSEFWLDISSIPSAYSNLTISDTLTLNTISANGTIGTAGQALLSNGTSTYWGVAGSKWTDIGSDIYRNSKVVIGGTTTPASQFDLQSGSAAQAVVDMLTGDTLDLLLGQMFTKTVTAGITFKFLNVPASRGTVVILHITNGGSFSVGWPGSVKWPGAIAPLLTAVGTDILTFVTHDGGITWRGNIYGKDIK